MARVTYGALVTDLKGSIGGTTFQRNSSGPVARSRPSVPVNSSAPQSNRQIALLRLVAAWPTLTLAQQTEWNDLAASELKQDDWGNYKRLSGYQWFLSYNLNAFTQFGSYWSTPESYVLVDPVPEFTLSASSSSFTINFSGTQSFPGSYAGIYATPPMRQSTSKLRRSTFLISLWGTSSVSSIQIILAYEAFFNIIWSDFYNSSQAFIIIRMKNFIEDSGFTSLFTSSIIKIDYTV